MAEELIQTLMRFHREIVMPDVRGALDELREEIRERDERTSGHLDAIYHRLIRIDEVEYPQIILGLREVEQRLDRVEQRLDRVEQRLDRIEQRMDRVENTIESLQTEIALLRQRIDALELRFDRFGKQLEEDQLAVRREIDDVKSQLVDLQQRSALKGAADSSGGGRQKSS